MLVVHQFPSQHRDLGDGSAPREAAEAEEAEDKLPETKCRDRDVAGFGIHQLSVTARTDVRLQSGTGCG